LFEESGLGSSTNPVDESLVDILLAQHYEVSGRLERLATEKDDTFRLRTGGPDYLVKVSPPDEPEQVVALQTAVMRFLERSVPDLPIQRVRLTVDGLDHVLVPLEGGGVRVLRVFGFVDGAVWTKTDPDAVQLAKVGEMLGRVDVALQDFAHPADTRRLVWDVGQFHHLTELAEHTTNADHRRLARQIFRRFGSTVVPRLSSLESQVIHGDYSPHNVVVDPRRDEFVTGVIDFGDTVRSAVIFDPAVSLANLVGRGDGHPWRDACSFLEGYERVRPIKESERPLLPVAALARLTLRALIANRRAEQVPDRRDYLLAHAKDDWINVERAIAVPLDAVLAQGLS
jgi:Ser/Thr protein kinase RdoA (MazF antagonist)